jgi:hypothetical protein
VLVFALGTLTAPALALAADRINVQATILSDHIHLTGSYWVQKPKTCPATKPGLTNRAAIHAWDSSYCANYREQSADLEVRALYNGRVVYAGSDSGFGRGFGGASPLDGASIDTSIYVFQLAGGSFNGCPGGTYTWVVTLIDPYFRPNFNVSARGSFRCG